jgi:hypothetical protein
VNFWDNVDMSGGPDACWPWKLSLGTWGYGQAFWDLGDGKGKRNVVASRAAWVIVNGLPEGDLCVLHRCDNRACCNPAHMFLGTRPENTADMLAKGRHRVLVGPDSPAAKLSADDVREIRRRAAHGEQLLVLAGEFHLHPSGISRLVRRLSYRDVQ